MTKSAPTIPASAEPAITSNNIANGCIFKALPCKIGCSRFPSICCTKSTPQVIATAIQIFPVFTKTTNTAIEPETSAPTIGMNAPINTSTAIGSVRAKGVPSRIAILYLHGHDIYPYLDTDPNRPGGKKKPFEQYTEEYWQEFDREVVQHVSPKAKKKQNKSAKQED